MSKLELLDFPLKLSSYLPHLITPSFYFLRLKSLSSFTPIFPSYPGTNCDIFTLHIQNTYPESDYMPDHLSPPSLKTLVVQTTILFLGLLPQPQADLLSALGLHMSSFPPAPIFCQQSCQKSTFKTSYYVTPLLKIELCMSFRVKVHNGLRDLCDWPCPSSAFLPTDPLSVPTCSCHTGLLLSEHIKQAPAPEPVFQLFPL